VPNSAKDGFAISFATPKIETIDSVSVAEEEVASTGEYSHAAMVEAAMKDWSNELSSDAGIFSLDTNAHGFDEIAEQRMQRNKISNNLDVDWAMAVKEMRSGLNG
jgi:hypothetical protein